MCYSILFNKNNSFGEKGSPVFVDGRRSVAGEIKETGQRALTAHTSSLYNTHTYTVVFGTGTY